MVVKGTGQEVTNALVGAIPVALLASVVAAAQGLILNLLTSISAGFAGVAAAVFALVWLVVGTMLRPGKESFIGTLITLAAVAAVFTIVALLPVTIPLVGFTFAFSVPEIFLALGTIYMAEAFWLMIRKQAGF